ncbi:MAG TPA: amidase [Mycobacteriales bacterium]|nr:amidase [Mycobacteriales bacterium]
MSDHPQDLSLCAQAQAIAAGELSAADLLDATFARIEQRNPTYNAIAATFPEESRAMLAAAPAGPLFGVPVTVKDMFSLPWRGYRNGTPQQLNPPSASGAFRRLRDAGAVIVGVDNQHELGLGTTGLVSAHGPSGNPWNPAHCTGGSSGGSAAAVGTRMVGGSVGSDSGGSMRLPAGWSGVVGLKFTFGALPYDGYSGANSTLSAPGVFGRDSDDTRLMAEALLARPLPRGQGAGLRVGVVRSPFWMDIDPEVEAACAGAIAAAGGAPHEIELPYAELAAPAGGVRASVELTVAVPPSVLPDLDQLTQGMIAYSARVPALRLVRADRIRARMRRELAAAFERVDVLAWPSNPAPAPPIANPVLQLPSGPALPDMANLRQAVIANLAGVPGVSVPVGRHSSGLPIGLQLLGRWGAEATLLDAALHIENVSQRAWVDGGPAALAAG